PTRERDPPLCGPAPGGDTAGMTPASPDRSPPVGLFAELRADQRRRWQAGERVPAEEYLERHPALRADPEGAVDLVYGEYLLREGVGEQPEWAEYLRRFPQYADVLRAQVELHRALVASSDGTIAYAPRPPSEDVTLPVGPAAPGDGAGPAVPGYELSGE